MEIEGFEHTMKPQDEREVIMARFLDKDSLQAAGEGFGINWFNDNTTDYSNKEEARSAVAETLTDACQIEELLNTYGDSDNTWYPWFYGNTYTVVQESPDEFVVRREPATEEWQRIRRQTLQADSDGKMMPFIKGMLEAAEDFTGDRLSVTFSEACQAGAPHYSQEGMPRPTARVELPASITGVETRNPNSGRRYYIARETAPVIEAAVDEQLERHRQPGQGNESRARRSSQESETRDLAYLQEGHQSGFVLALDEVEVTEEDEKEFQEITENEDALEYWSDFVAPEVKHREHAKKALLCMLASPEDRNGEKLRLNALFYGPPGTGKSALKRWLVENFGAESIDGARVSKADLTLNKTTAQPGVLLRAHKGLAVIEEADEMDDDALGAALTALGESGQVEIRNERYPAEVRGLLLGNYQSEKDIARKHGEAILDRFEFLVSFQPLDEEHLDDTLSWRYRHFAKTKPHDDTQRLKKYLSWVRDYDPEITDQATEQIEEVKSQHVDAIDNVRTGVSVMSVAYTIARLNREPLEETHFETALEMVVEE